MTTNDPDTFAANIEALAQSNPGLAERLAATSLPDGVERKKGRDGNWTFKLPGANGKQVWLGESSMPTVSAEAIVAPAISQPGNVILPGMLTGYEAFLLARRSFAHCVTFVLESDPLRVALALRLYDYSDALRAGRLVLLVDSNPADCLAKFFESNLGFEFPKRLLTPPQLAPAQIADLQKVMNQTAEHVARIQHQATIDAARLIQNRDISELANEPRIALVSSDASPQTIEHARRLERAAENLGWNTCTNVPDSPARCSTFSRIDAIRRVKADFVLCICCTPDGLRTVLPDAPPMVSWFLPDSGISTSTASKLGSNDLAMVCSQEYGDILIGGGADKNRVVHLAPGADSAPDIPPCASEEANSHAKADVTVLADFPSGSPETSGVVLHSHVALWRAIEKTLAGRVDSYTFKDAVAVLKEAEKQSRVSLKEDKIRDHFLGLTRAVIAPRIIATADVYALTQTGYSADLWGCNWEQNIGSKKNRRGNVPSGEALRQVFQSAGILLFPIAAPRWIQTALDAAAHGAKVVCREPDQTFEKEYPQLADLCNALPTYKTRRELCDRIRKLKIRSDNSGDSSENLSDLVRKQHTLAHRLQTMWEMVKNSRKSGG